MIDASILPSLNDVLTVAQRGSVAAAAASLHKTPSAVSQQIRRVEEHFGVEIFERRGRGLRLSAVGEKLIGPATRLFDQAEAVFDLLSEMTGAEPATLRLAISDYLGKDLLAPVMRQLAGAEVPVRFEITTAHSSESLRLLESGDVDLAIVTSDRSKPGLEERKLFDQPLLWVAPPDGADCASPIERLRADPVLRLAPGSIGRLLLDQFLEREGITPVSTIDVPSVSLLLAYAKAGVGVGLAPALPLVSDANDSPLPRRQKSGSGARPPIEPGDPPALNVEAAPMAPLAVKLMFRKAFRMRPPIERFTKSLLIEAQSVSARLTRYQLLLDHTGVGGPRG